MGGAGGGGETETKDAPNPADLCSASGMCGVVT